MELKSYYEMKMLTLKTALGIDWHMHKRADNKNFHCIKDLVEELEKIERSYKGPKDCVMLSQFLWENNRSRKSKEVEEINLQLHLFRKDLETLSIAGRKKQKELLKSCLDLSNLYAVYEEPFRYGLVA